MDRPGRSATTSDLSAHRVADLERGRTAEDEHRDDAFVGPRVVSDRLGGGEDRPQRFAREVVAPEVLLAPDLVDRGEGVLPRDLERRELARLRGVREPLRRAGPRPRSHEAHDLGLRPVDRRRVEDRRAVEQKAGLVVVRVAVRGPPRVGDRERPALPDQRRHPDVRGRRTRGRWSVSLRRRPDLGHRPVGRLRREGDRRLRPTGHRVLLVVPRSATRYGQRREPERQGRHRARGLPESHLDHSSRPSSSVAAHPVTRTLCPKRVVRKSRAGGPEKPEVE